MLEKFVSDTRTEWTHIPDDSHWNEYCDRVTTLQSSIHEPDFPFMVTMLKVAHEDDADNDKEKFIFISERDIRIFKTIMEV